MPLIVVSDEENILSYSTGYRPGSAMTVTLDDRVTFIRKVYTHLAGAIGLFVLFSWALDVSGVSQSIYRAVFTGGGMLWFIFLIAFMAVGYGARAMARGTNPLGIQYLGLGIYALFEALLFAPLLALASDPHYALPNVLPDAAIITLATFAGLTGFVLIYNKDFSFLGGFLAVVGMLAIGIIFVSLFFGLDLGVWFSAGMILFAALAVLYSTSNILRYYPPNMYVAAALELFAEIALLFWYVLRILMQTQRR